MAGRRTVSRRNPQFAEAELAPAFAKLVQAADHLPEITQSTWFNTPSLKVRGKSLCRVKDPDTVVLMCPLEEKELLIAAAPDIYFETDHYKGWPATLVRIHVIPTAELALRLERAFAMHAPKAVLKAWRKDWPGVGE
jgi:hypothetical protein